MQRPPHPLTALAIARRAQGAAALAHCVLSGSVPQLEKLYVQSNQIMDAGVRALFKAFGAESRPCPLVVCVNCRDNVVSAPTLRALDPCPIYFQV
jgi:hypothetical protein